MSANDYTVADYIEPGYFTGDAEDSASLFSEFSLVAAVEIFIPTQPNTYVDEDYVEAGYFEPVLILPVDFVILVNSNSTLNCVVGKIVETAADLVAEFTQTATISHIQGSDMFAFGEAQLAVTLARIRDNNIEAQAAFDCATDGGVTRTLDIEANSAFDLVSTPERSRDYELHAEAAFSFVDVNAGLDTVAANVVTENISNLAAHFDQSADTGTIVSAVSTLKSFFGVFTTRYFGSRPRNLPIPSTTTFFDSSIRKFGTHSLKPARLPSPAATFPYVVIPDVNDNWAAEAWIRSGIPNVGFNQVLIRIAGITFGLGQASGVDTQVRTWAIIQDGSPGVVFSAQPVFFGLSTQFHHLAVVKSESTISWYVNGNRYATTSAPNSYLIDQLRIFPGNVPGQFIDEFSFVIGSTYGSNAANTSITVPTTTRTNLPLNTQWLYHFDNNGLDDIIPSAINQVGNASLVSISNANATLSGPVTGSAGLNSQFTAGIVAEVDRGADLTAFAEAALDIDALRIRPLAADLEVVTDKSADVQAIRNVEFAASSEFTIEIFGGAQRNATAEFASVASKLAIVVKVGSVVVDLNAQAIVDVDASVTTDAQATLSAEAQQLTAADRTRSTDVVLEATSILAVDANIVFDQTINAAAEFTKTADANFVANVGADLFSEFTNDIDASGGVVRAFANLQSDFNQTADANLSRNNSITATSQSDLTADAVTLLGAGSALTADSALNIDYLRFRDNEIITQSVAVKVIVAVKNVNQDIDLVSTTDIDADAVKTTAIVEDLTSVADIAAIGVITAQAAANVNAATELSAEGTTNITGEIHAQSQFSLACDAEVTFVIALEAFSNASVDLDVLVFRGFDIAVAATSDIDIDGARIRHVDSQLVAETSLESTAERLVDSGVLEFASIASKLSLGRVVNLDMKIFRIPPETRIHTITSETRVHRIRR